MGKKLNDYVNTYKVQLEKGDIQIAYEHLLKYVMSLKAYFQNTQSDRYSFGNVSPGYMDFTYFPFFDDFLRERKLRFGIVLNHQQMRFELWLMGQNAEVQNQYWELLKTTKWNIGRDNMPRYSVLETILVEELNFNDLDALSVEIASASVDITKEIMNYIPK
ncbi:MAG: DUF7000 family protein [Lachnospiraceae bacterium]